MSDKYMEPAEYELCKTCNGNCCRVGIHWSWKEDEIPFTWVADCQQTPYGEILKHTREELYNKVSGVCLKLDKNNRCTVYKDRPMLCKTYFCEGRLYQSTLNTVEAWTHDRKEP